LPPFLNTNYDYDLKFVANRAEVTANIEYIENKPLAYYPAKRGAFRDGSCNLEMPLLLAGHNAGNAIADFLVNVTNYNNADPETNYLKNWAFYIYLGGNFVNRGGTLVHTHYVTGLFILSEASINVTESGVPSASISGNIIYHPVHSGVFS